EFQDSPPKRRRCILHRTAPKTSARRPWLGNSGGDMAKRKGPVREERKTEQPRATPGAKMLYLIKRRAGVSREELVMHWFANHMPLVIKSQRDAAAAGRLHARRYIATLFDANVNGEHPWDGIAQLWWDQALPKPKTPTGTTPRDSFQQKAQPYVGW